MKLPIILTLIGLVLTLSLSGCATEIPKKTAADDCLVLIRCTLTNETQFEDARIFKFFFSDDIKPIWVREGKNSFVMVRVQQPGAMLVKLHSEISKVRGNFYGEPTDADMDLDLPYQAGKVIIADFAFVRKITKNKDSTGFITYHDFKRLSPEEKEVLMDMAIKEKIVKKWEGS